MIIYMNKAGKKPPPSTTGTQSSAGKKITLYGQTENILIRRLGRQSKKWSKDGRERYIPLIFEGQQSPQSGNYHNWALIDDM